MGGEREREDFPVMLYVHNIVFWNRSVVFNRFRQRIYVIY